MRGGLVTRFLESTVGKLAVFYVDLACGLMSRAFHHVDGDDDADRNQA